MKRIAWWALSTLTALILTFGYHTSTSGVVTASPSTVIHSETSSGTGSTGSGDSTSAAGTTVTGDAVSTRYGPVQVSVTVEGDQITDVTVPQYPSSSPKDAQINQSALPTLIQETLDQQSADVQMVSGATHTSDGYRQSLQSALDQVQS